MNSNRRINPLQRQIGLADLLVAQVAHALNTTLGPAPPPARATPAPSHALNDDAGNALSETERQHAAGLMRINHAGEVCAQALYLGQAAVARDETTRAHLQAAAAEEQDHLAWCAARLSELDSKPSLLNPLWYVGSFAIGAGAALAGDRWSLGFVIETERQVEAHLGEHLKSLPASDEASRTIVREMQLDEARHGQNAMAQGGIELPQPIPGLMKIAAGVMKSLAYRV